MLRRLKTSIICQGGTQDNNKRVKTEEITTMGSSNNNIIL
jgi:hypothetical protein